LKAYMCKYYDDMQNSLAYRAMTWMQRGWYNHLLEREWDNSGFLPNNEALFRQICWADPDEWERESALVLAQFIVTEDRQEIYNLVNVRHWLYHARNSKSAGMRAKEKARRIIDAAKALDQEPPAPAVKEKPAPRTTKVVPQEDPAEGSGDPPEKEDKAGGSDVFDAFWAAWPKTCPRKQDKMKCRKKWKQLKLSAASVERIMASLESNKKTKKWTKNGGEFIEAPLVWLNGQRWEDDVATHDEPVARPEEKPKPPSPLPDDLDTHGEPWEKALYQLRLTVDEENFSTWLAPVVYLGRSGDTVYLAANSEYDCGWVSRYYGEQIAEAVGVEFVDIRVVEQEEDLPF